MSKLAKKIFVSVVVALAVAAVAVPPSAHAQTAAELQTEIDALMATIASLSAQIAALGGTASTGGGIAGIPPGFTFTANLGQGSSGVDVMYVQMLLNSNSATQVAATGVGSAGSETQFYGPLTEAGVTRFQNKYASEILTPLGLAAGTGFFGPSSRAKANTLLAVAPAPPPPPPPPPGTEPPPPPPDEITTPGAEGSVIVTVNSNPASGAVLNTGETEAVTAVDVQVTGSDVLVSRLDLQFDTRAWLYISEMTVSDGTTSKTIAVTEANTTEVTVGSVYSVRVGDLNILIPKDTTKKLTVTVKAVGSLPVGTTTKDIVLTFKANAIRGTDGAGLSQTGPTADLGGTRTITVQEPSTADLELTAHADNPKARAVLVNSTAETTGVTLAVFNLKAKNNDAILRTVEVEDTDSIATSASNAPKVLYLYDGDTLLSSTSSLAAASATLANIDLTIPKDTTKTLTLKADLAKATGNYEEGATSTWTVGTDASSINAEDASSFAAATVSGSKVTAGTAYMYIKAPKLALAATPTVEDVGGNPSGSSSPTALRGTLKIAITAQGGDIYVPAYSATTASNGLEASSGRDAASATVTMSYSSDADFGDSNNTTYVVRSGQTQTFTVVATIDTCGALTSKHFDRVDLDSFKWDTTVALAEQTPNTWTWGLTDFQTPELELLLCA